MTQNEGHDDRDSRTVASILETVRKAIASGQPVAIAPLLDTVPGGLRDSLLKELLLLELQYRQRSGISTRVDEYLAMFPLHADIVMQAFRESELPSEAGSVAESSAASTRDELNSSTQTIIGDNLDFSVADTVQQSNPDNNLGNTLGLDVIIPVYPKEAAYTVLKEIDRGGMGVVLKVRDENLKRDLALKVIRGQERGDTASPRGVNEDTLARFVREAEVTGRLDHPGVVPVHELATDSSGRTYFTMKFVQGKTLSKVFAELKAKSPQWSLQKVLEVIIRVCDTLAFAHSKGIIHRDLKPANIMVGEFGETYVMDWGLAKILGEAEEAPLPGMSRSVAPDPVGPSQTQSPARSQSHSQTMYGDVMGTAYYMPPEQAEGRIDELDQRSDIYSVGALLYEVLAGQCPYRDGVRGTDKVLEDVKKGPPKAIRDLNRKAPPELIAIAEKAMSRPMADRYSRVADMADDLRDFLSQRVVSAYQTGLMARLRKWVIRNQSITIAGLLTLLTIASALGVVALILLTSKSEIERTNSKLSTEVAEKTKAIKDKDIAAENERIAREEERIARDEVNGLSLMSHSKNVLMQGDPVLASLLGLESVVRFSTPATNEALYAALAKLSSALEFKVDSRTTHIVWSPDGTRLLSLHANGTGRIWNSVTKQADVMMVNSREKAFASGLFSHDGTSILTAGEDGRAALWDSKTGVRTLAMTIQFQVPRPSGDTLNRPDTVAAAFCADASSGQQEALIAVASAARAVHLFDRATGKEIAILEPPSDAGEGPFTIMKVSPDGKTIAAGCESGKVYLWSNDRRLIKVIDAHQQPIQSLDFSSDSRLFVTGAYAHSETERLVLSPARLWHTETGELHHEISPKGLNVASVAFHPLKPMVAVGLGDGTLCLWDIYGKRGAYISASQNAVIYELDFSDRGDSVVSLSNANNLTTWLVQSHGSTVALTVSDRLIGHRKRISRVAYNRTGSHVASSTGSEVRIWESGSKNAVPTFGSPTHTGNVHLSRGGDRIFEYNRVQKQGRLWSCPDVGLISELDMSGDLYTAYLTADGHHVAMMFADGTVRLLDIRDGRLEFETKLPVRMDQVRCFGNLLSLANNDEATVRDWTTSELKDRFTSPQFGPFCVAPDGRSILAVRRDDGEGSMTHIDLTNGLKQNIENSATCNFGHFSTSGRYFWCHGTQHPRYSHPVSSHVKLIDTQTNNVLFATQECDAIVRQAVVDRSDTVMLVDYVQRVEHTAEVYSIPDGKLLTKLGSPEGEVIGNSHDLKLVAINSVDEGTQLWETVTGKPVRSLEVSGYHCKIVTFSPDSKYFAVQLESAGGGVESSRVALWKTEPLELMTVLPGENRCDSSTTFFPDGKQLLTTSSENQIRLWPLDVVEHAKKHLPRRLTADEERMYGVDKSRAVPTDIQPEVHERSLKLEQLSEKIRLLSPVTEERRNQVRELLTAVQESLNTTATEEEISLVMAAVETLRSGPFETDPMVLAGIAGLYQQLERPEESLQLLEMAARHPRAFELETRLRFARERILPQIASLRSADEIAETAFSNDATPRQKESFEKCLAWAKQNSPRISDYLQARKYRTEGNAEKARSLLQSLVETQATSQAVTGPELFLQLAECELELNQPEAAASILRTALNEERFRAREVWNRWLQISFAHLKLTPRELITQLPMKSEGPPPELRYEDQVLWLLEQLSHSRPLRINCGGERYVVSDLAVWESDRFFTHGYGYFGTEGDASLFAEPIANTNDPFLYRSERWFSNDRHDKPAGYQIPVPNGTYEVTLGFAEIFDAKRSFDVVSEDATELSDYDPGRGAWATAEQFSWKSIVNDGQLDITFVARNNESAKVSCLKIVPIDSAASSHD